MNSQEHKYQEAEKMGVTEQPGCYMSNPVFVPFFTLEKGLVPCELSY